MKNIVFVILDEFSDWEAAFLSSALNDKNITKNYTTNFASIDKNLKFLTFENSFLIFL